MSERPDVAALRPPRKQPVVEHELEGGLHALVLRRTKIPLVEVRLVVPLSPSQILRPATALVLSESLLAGTEERDRSSVAEEVERLGGTLGATLSDESLIVHGSCLASRLKDFLSLLGEVLTEAAYRPDEVSGDRERTADEVALALSRPETLAGEALARRLYGRHPYGTEMPRPDGIRRVRPSAVRSLHDALLTPRAGHLVLVGDVQPRRALSIASGSLEAWLALPAAPPDAVPEPPEVKPGPLLFLHRSDSVQSNVRLGGVAPGRLDPDWPAAALANAVFGGMFTSRIVTNLRERNGYTYSPRSGVRHLKKGSHSEIAADVSTAVTAASLVETRYELGRIASLGVSEDELEAARRYVMGSFMFRVGTQSGLASTLAALAAAGVDPGYLASYPARVSRLTKDEVDAAAARYFAPTRLVTVVVGDADEVLEPLGAVEAVELA